MWQIKGKQKNGDWFCAVRESVQPLMVWRFLLALWSTCPSRGHVKVTVSQYKVAVSGYLYPIIKTNWIGWQFSLDGTEGITEWFEEYENDVKLYAVILTVTRSQSKWITLRILGLTCAKHQIVEYLLEYMWVSFK